MDRKGDEWCVSLMSDKWIQRWSISTNGTETFSFEDFEIVRKIREAFHRVYWLSHDVASVETFLLDMHSTDGNVYVLAAATNLSHTPQMHFAIFTLTEGQSQFSVVNVCQIKHTAYFSGNDNDDNLKYKFIFNRSIAYFYGDKTIFEVILNGKSNENSFLLR